MFFILSKVLYFLLTPVCWILALIITSFVLKNSRLKKRFLVVAIISFIFFTNNFIFNLFTDKWEVESKSVSAISNKYEYGIVLGGMVSENILTGKVQFSESIDRLMQAMILYKQGKIKKILITGGSGALLNQGSKEAKVLQTFCISLGIPKDCIVIEFDSRNTHENATFTKNITGIDSVELLITSAFHMRRAAACFKHEGFKFDILSTNTLAELNMAPDDYFIPKAEPLLKWSYIIKEWVGYAAYKIAGYI
jgi:uncharacterized SAM-binding protein YcdF (DUF218 family)